ncbi:hypothetical protein BGZ49_009787 [Haplosporangium sp. Z 27]|nr:hypothetical protein BGZ49_009787 [Haplosporangium sp. Z 27]
MSTLPLAFQKEIVAELAAEDALLIMARGLGLRNIIGAFLQVYSQPQNLVLLINTNSEEETALRDDLLRSTNVGQSGTYFRSITSELSIADRSDLYRYGGVMAITSRILVMDLLTGRIPVHLITGILVANAHRVTATSTEAFILRLYRQGNSEGFVKAFSDQPEVFSTGFATLEKTMKLLYLRKVNLWPRFHVTVTESLESHATDVIEIRQPMTKAMKAIQSSIIDCMDVCLQELRRSSSAIEIDIDDFTVEKALFKSFDVIIRRQLDPIWHRVSSKTKQLVGDLKTLRNLLGYLVSYDSVNFNLYLETILATHKPTSGSYWLLTDPADKIYSTAKGRVFLHQAGYTDPDDPNMLPNMRPILEELPKWNVLSDILDEVELEMHHAPHPEGMDTVLIMTQDQRTCTQLRRYISTPKSNSQTRGKPLMRELLHGYLRWKSNMKHFKDNVASQNTSTSSTQASNSGNRSTGSTRGQPPNKRRRVRGGSNMLAPVTKHTTESFEKEAEVIATFIQSTQDEPISSAFVHDQELEEVDDFTDYFGLVEPSHLVVVHSYNGESDSRLLENIKPRFIIMYDPDPTFVRCVEVYKARHPGKQVRVYFTVYDNSVEEQLYLSALRREKDAFTKLIREKSIMVLPIGDIQTKQVQDQSLLRNIHTRIAGGGKTGDDHPLPRIVVDSREFRSSLPFILHSQGMILDPCTITVGDYVLSPNICVERKSISDLISSFSSGRLYTQVEAMTVHYSHPVLLIEFDQDKSFSLQDKSEMRADISVTELSSKLVLLTIAFPTLRLIWSSSVHATVEIFEDLKRSEDEPDVLQAQAVGVDPEQEIESAFNLTPQDVLRSLPGITSKNYKHIMNNVEDIRELAEMEFDRLSELMGEGPAQTLWNFFHKDSRLDNRRYLRWLGVQTKVFSVGNYRREIIGVEVTNDFFSPTNTATAELRMKIANACLDDMILWFAKGGQVGILDGSNTTEERRKVLVEKFKEAGINYLFIESICDNPKIIDANIRSVKVSSPDYVGWKDVDAVNDFKRRIENHVPFYTTISNPDLSYVKMINVGEKIIVNNVRGFLQSKNGISLNEQSYRVDAPLAPAGHRYAENLKNFLLTLRENQNNVSSNGSIDSPRQLTVWTSPRKRSFQTAAHFLDHEEIIVRQRSVLAERNPGVCDQMTTEEIEQRYPNELIRAQKDPYRHRFPRAELLQSYYDLANRLEKVILELEREKNDVLIISHESVIKCLYGYIFGLSEQDIPSLEIPEGTLLELTPTAYKTEETRHVITDSIASVNWQQQADAVLSLAGKVPASPMFLSHYLPDDKSSTGQSDSNDVVTPLSSPTSLPKLNVDTLTKDINIYQNYPDDSGMEFRL